MEYSRLAHYCYLADEADYQGSSTLNEQGALTSAANRFVSAKVDDVIVPKTGSPATLAIPCIQEKSTIDPLLEDDEGKQ